MSIIINNLSKNFQEIKAIDDISINFKKNKISGLIGFNGSGKTTTFNILANFIEDYKGNFTFDGKKINKEILSKISYLASGTESKNRMKVIKHFYILGQLYGLKKLDVWKIVNALSKKIDFEEFLNKSIKSLSKGNQQKIKIIAIFLNPNMEYLFLDEPFDGLDPIMVEKVKKIFLELKNTTIIITSHRMEIVQEMCEEFFILKKGKLAESRKIKNTILMITINKEVDLKEITKLKYVQKILKNKTENIILINDIKYFKNINKILLKDKNYTYSSLKKEKIAELLFKGEKL